PRHYNLKDLLLSAHDGTLHKATELYMDEPDGTKMLSDFFGVNNPVVRRLHPQYLIQRSDDQKQSSWLQWLKNDMKVNTLPKLVGSDGKVSPEFTFIVNNSPSSAWLKLLRDYCSTHSHSDNVKRFFANVLVDCRGGRRLKLCDAYMPTPEVLKEASDEQMVDLIAIGDPENPSWSKLTHLGLRLKPDLSLFLKALLRLQSAPLTSDTASRAKRIYGSLDGFAQKSGENQKKIQAAFTNAHLIFVPLQSGGKWVGKTVCRWKSDACLSKLYDLKALYDGYLELFHRTLSIKEANAADIIDEMEHLDATAEATSKAVDLLVALERHMHVVNEINVTKERLRKHVNVFPVQGKDGLISLRSLNDESWFIADADKPSLKKLFDRKVDLLALEDDKLRKCPNLRGRLELDRRALSKHIREETVLKGEKKLNQELTDYVRVRAKYVALLANSDKRESLKSRFSTIDVISVDELRQRTFIQMPSGPIYGADEASRACVEYRQDSVQVLVPNSSQGSRNLPVMDLCGHLVKEFGIGAEQKANMLFIFFTEDLNFIEWTLEKEQVLEGAFNPAMQPLTLVIDEEMADQERRKTQTTKSTPIPIPRSGPSMSFTGGTIPAFPPNLNHNTTAGRRGTEISGSSAAVRSRGVGRSSDTSSCAATSDSGVGFGGPTNHIRFGEAEPVFVGRSSSHPKAWGDVPERDLLQKDSSLDLSKMTKALHVDLPSTRDLSNGMRSAPPTVGQADEYQVKIGIHGEHMAYKILNQKFSVTYDQWTSSPREEHGFPAFSGVEADHADFTVTDYQVCQRISNYLINEGVVDRENFAGRKVTAYHIEVKATMGRCSEPFSLSDAQLDLARYYHSDRSEIYMVMRLFNLNATKPSVDFFVDPYSMMLNGQLSFTAPGGLLLGKAG
ncbi:hypothetical protein KC319_g9307, partial [Hortaea werneckii]